VSRVPVRWRDLDPLGHVNTAVFLTLLETGRDIWLREVLGGIFGAADYAVARVEVDFRAEIPQGTEYVETTHEVGAVGRSSITLNERLTDPAGMIVTESRTVIVLWDPDRRTSRAVTDVERGSLQGRAVTT
jgi:acyl-CoA thioester hydrolase